jgi:transglutaminase-like putative cysteine protease
VIPARFVAGYAYVLQPPDFHAYFEAYLDGTWYILDSTRLAPQTGLIRVGTGHDAADTSFATIFGPATFSSMKVTMELLDRPVPTYMTDAISTSSSTQL